MFEMFRFELRYRLGYVSTYLYGILILFIPIYMNMLYDGVEVAVNSPFNIYFVMVVIFQFAMVMLAGMVMQAFSKDFETRFYEILFTKPISKVQYVFGRLFACMFMVVVVVFFSMVVFEVSLKFINIKPDLVLKPIISWYLNPFFLFVLPNLYFLATFFVSITILTKKTRNIFLAIFTFFVFYFLMMYLANHVPDKMNIFAVLDISGLSHFYLTTLIMKPVELNSMQICFDNVMFLNRGVWFVISTGVLLFAVKRFKLHGGKRKIEVADAIHTHANSGEIVNFRCEQVYGFRTLLFQIASKFMMNNRILLKSLIFWWVITVSVLFMITLLPVRDFSYSSSSAIGNFLAYVYIIFLFLVIPFFTGELVWASREQKFTHVEDHLPFPNLVSFISQYMSIVALIVGYAVLSVIVGVVYQLRVGNYQIEIKDYFNIFFLKYIPLFLIISLYVFIIQNNVVHKYLGHFLFFCSIIVIITLKFLTDHILLVPTILIDVYTGMNGFGKNGAMLFWLYLYWFLVLVFFTGLNVIVWKRGANQYNPRQILHKLKKKQVIIYHIVLFSLILPVASYIFYNTNILNHYESKKEILDNAAIYRQQYEHLDHTAQPEIRDMVFDFEIYPKQTHFKASGTYTLINNTEAPVDSLLINYQSSLDDYGFTGANIPKLIYRDDKMKTLLFRFENGFAVEDTLLFHFAISCNAKGFTNYGSKKVINKNGSFIRTGLFPSIGYDGDKGANYLSLWHEQYWSGASSFVNIKATISTAADQTVVATGNLIESWKVNDRNYFTYEIDDVMITLFAFTSGKYEVYTTQRENVTLEFHGLTSHKDLAIFELYYHKNFRFDFDVVVDNFLQKPYFGAERSETTFRFVEVPLELFNLQDRFMNMMVFSERERLHVTGNK